MAEETYYDDREKITTDTHKPARPLKFFKDRDGYGWLCDKGIDPEKDFREQGCWRCDEMAFPTGEDDNIRFSVFRHGAPH